MKQYRKIPSTLFLYEVSRDGTLRNVKSKKILRGYIGKDKNNEYVHIQLVYGGRTHHKRIHQLVMECWGKPRPSEKHIIDHIDGDKTNNRIENLRWATRKENVENSEYYRSGERSRRLEASKFPKKPIKVNGQTFPSRWEAGKFIKQQSGCSQSVKGLCDRMYLKRKKIFGFDIEYL